MLAVVNAAWTAAEQGEAATTYALTRVRVELWETAPARTCQIDDVTIDGVLSLVEPGMPGVELGPNVHYTTLNFVEVRDRYGRTEVLAPILGASQAVTVGPLLPELFNDSEGYARFKPMIADTPLLPATGAEFTYAAIQVANPS